jgi:hypothetical protein
VTVRLSNSKAFLPAVLRIFKNRGAFLEDSDWLISLEKTPGKKSAANKDYREGGSRKIQWRVSRKGMVQKIGTFARIHAAFRSG